MGAWSRAKSLLSWRRIWGPGITLLGLLGQLVHWGWLSLDIFGRLDLLWRVVESMGGTPALIASIVSSWQFSFALIAIGLIYTVFVGEPEQGVQRHTWWPYVAASIFFICLTAMGLLAIYGAYEVQLRKAYAAGAAGMSRGSSPANPKTDGNQRSLHSAARVLMPDQQRILISEGSELHSVLSGMTITYFETDMEAFSYASALRATFALAAIKTGNILEQELGEPNRSGVMIEVADKNNPPPSAIKLQQLLLIADIHADFVNTVPRFQNNPMVLFVGPLPIQR